MYKKEEKSKVLDQSNKKEIIPPLKRETDLERKLKKQMGTLNADLKIN